MAEEEPVKDRWVEPAIVGFITTVLVLYFALRGPVEANKPAQNPRSVIPGQGEGSPEIIATQIGPQTYGEGSGVIVNLIIDGMILNCVAMNTDKYGFDQYFDPHKPEISSGIQALGLLGYVGGPITVVKGYEVSTRPDLTGLVWTLDANHTTFCISPTP